MKPDPVPEAEIRCFLEVYEARGGRDIVGPLLRSRALRMTPELAREVLELRAENERLREWSFDWDALGDHAGAALVALRVRDQLARRTDWEVYLAEVDDVTGDLFDPSSGDRIGWHATDVEAWRPCNIEPPTEAQR